MRALAASHLVLVILDQTAGVEKIYPAKVFEAMHIGRPCLTLAPEGALTRLVRKHGIGECVAPRDEAAIASLLAQKLRAFRDGEMRRSGERTAHVGIEKFDRRVIAGSFADAMRAAITLKRSGRVSASA